MITLPLYHEKKIAVLGLGRSGMASAAALIASGAEVSVWDDNEQVRKKAESAGLVVKDFSDFSKHDADALIVAPGIAHRGKDMHAAIHSAREQNIPVWGDLELFSQYLTAIPKEDRPILIMVTGSNGKSTTTALMHHVLKYSNRNVQMGGNIGIPVLALQALGKGGIYVIEASSFQLDVTETLRPDFAVWLNISSDHIDRHGSLKNYIAAKQKIFTAQQKDDSVIIGVDDSASQKTCTELFSKGERNIIPISSRRALASGVHVTGGILWDAINGEGKQITNLVKHLPSLLGRHNAQNIAATYSVCHSLKLPEQKIVKAMKSFQGLPHRMELVGCFSGIRYINDSKATNSAASIEALRSFDSIYWIAGGEAKEKDFTQLRAEMHSVQRIYLIGKASAEMKEVFEGYKPVMETKSLHHAVVLASYHAIQEKKKNAVILLSPACASFDQFKNFEERGQEFKKAFEKICQTCTGNETEIPEKEVNAYASKTSLKKNEAFLQEKKQGSAA